MKEGLGTTFIRMKFHLLNPNRYARIGVIQFSILHSKRTIMVLPCSLHLQFFRKFKWNFVVDD